VSRSVLGSVSQQVQEKCSKHASHALRHAFPTTVGKRSYALRHKFPDMSGKRSCVECGSRDLTRADDEIVCKSCGLVQEQIMRRASAVSGEQLGRGPNTREFWV
jgi:hypothetical protein